MRLQFICARPDRVGRAVVGDHFERNFGRALQVIGGTCRNVVVEKQ
jgi:hypothetical protein